MKRFLVALVVAVIVALALSAIPFTGSHLGSRVTIALIALVIVASSIPVAPRQKPAATDPPATNLKPIAPTSMQVWVTIEHDGEPYSVPLTHKESFWYLPFSSETNPQVFNRRKKLSDARNEVINRCKEPRFREAITQLIAQGVIRKGAIA